MRTRLNTRSVSLTVALLAGLLILSASSAISPAVAQQAAPATLHVGDAAPDLSVARWWKNKKLDSFHKNRVYFVDFWASWDDPSRQSLAEVASLKQSYASEGLEAVAISTNDDPDNAADFLNEAGGQFDFFIGMDNKGASWNNWGRAAGQDHIPMAFLVDAQGKVAWIGDPKQEGIEAIILKALSQIPLDQLPLTPKR